MPEPLFGVLAFGDSITNGGGELQWGVALQSWALWLARGLGVPYTGHARDGARAADVVRRQLPAHLERSARPEARFDVGCLYVGVNDVRAPDWAPGPFEAHVGTALAFLAERSERLLALTLPHALGRPSAGPRVLEANGAIERRARASGALVVDLAGFGARNRVMADRVHPTAFGQIEIAERALAVLERDGLPARVAPASLIEYETTRWGRLRGDATYVWRVAREGGRVARQRLATSMRL